MVYLAVEASRVWAGSDQELLSASASFPPVWRMLLFGDGSPTRTLQMLSGSRTTVDVTSMKVCEDGEPMLPLALEVPGPLLCRQVWLTNERGERLGYAASWWNVEEADTFLADKKEPIWRNLASRRTEVYRDIRSVFVGRSGALESSFGVEGPLSGRTYLFWHAGKPICAIYEVFSQKLCEYAGKMLID